MRLGRKILEVDPEINSHRFPTVALVNIRKGFADGCRQFSRWQIVKLSSSRSLHDALEIASTRLSFNLQPLDLLNHTFPSQLSGTWFSLAPGMFFTGTFYLASIISIFVAYHCLHSMFLLKVDEMARLMGCKDKGALLGQTYSSL